MHSCAHLKVRVAQRPGTSEILAPLDRPCAVLEEGLFFDSVPTYSQSKASAVNLLFPMVTAGGRGGTEGETETENCICIHGPKRKYRNMHDTVCVWRSQGNLSCLSSDHLV